MNFKWLLGSLVALLLMGMLAFYIIIPEDFDYSNIFNGTPKNNNFSIIQPMIESEAMFYPNIRFPDKKISYDIINCPLQKRKDMENAISIINNQTILNLYPVENNEQITITCDSKERLEGNFFIAGEGGPTNATKIDDKYIIFNSKVLLIKDSNCENPNIAIHELLHAIGFTHSRNKDNIMYNISKCPQRIGEDTISLINKVYTIESLSDLAIENASASIKGDMLNINITIKNSGYQPAEASTLEISSQNNEKIKDFPLDPLAAGYTTTISIQNIQLKNSDTISKLVLEIKTSQEELNKDNNKIIISTQ